MSDEVREWEADREHFVGAGRNGFAAENSVSSVPDDLERVNARARRTLPAAVSSPMIAALAAIGPRPRAHSAR